MPVDRHHHDTSILDTDLFGATRSGSWRRIGSRQAGSIPFSDFKPRKGEAIEKGFLNGRYGALPFIGD